MSLYQLMLLRRESSRILLSCGPAYDVIRQKIEALDFEPGTPDLFRNRPITETTPSYVPKGMSPSQVESYLRETVSQYIDLIEAALRLTELGRNAPLPAAPSMTAAPGSVRHAPSDDLPPKKADFSQYILAAGLTEKQRECFSLRSEHGLTIRAIARKLHLHHSTVEQHIRAATRKIQRLSLRQTGAKAQARGQA